jgi:hypothetical protein
VFSLIIVFLPRGRLDAGNKARALSFRIRAPSGTREAQPWMSVPVGGAHPRTETAESGWPTGRVRSRNDMPGLIETEVRESADSGPDLGGWGASNGSGPL